MTLTLGHAHAATDDDDGPLGGIDGCSTVGQDALRDAFKIMDTHEDRGRRMDPRLRTALGPALRTLGRGVKPWRASRRRRRSDSNTSVTEVHPALIAAIARQYGTNAPNVGIRVEHTVNDSVVAVVEHAGAFEVVKLALTTRAAGEFESQDSVLRALQADSGLGTWRRLIPSVTKIPDCNPGAVVESLVPGVSLRQALERRALSMAAAATLALDAIDPFHEITGEDQVVDQHHLERWIDEPLAVVRTHLEAGGTRSKRMLRGLDRIRKELRDDLDGATLSVGWVHGDYTAGNVLIDEHLRTVTGVVDWGRGRPGSPCLLDEVLLLTSLWCEANNVEFGTFVASRLHQDDETLRDVMSRRGNARVLPGERTLLLLGWLTHVADNLEKSSRYGRSSVWLANNVDPVLRAITDGRQLPFIDLRPGRTLCRRRRRDVAAEVANRRLPELTLLASAILWVSSLTRINLAAMSDLGLVSVLPVTFWLALVMLSITFAATVATRGASRWWYLACFVALVAMLHATPAILYGSLRYSWAWKHIGVVDYISRHHRVNPNLHALSAYQGWPGFFTLNSTATNAAGLRSSLSYASWAPPFFDLLDLAPLMLILRSLTNDRRLRFWAMWIFCLGNWVGQDYFSPQAFNYFLYLCVVAICLKWFARVSPISESRSSRPVMLAVGSILIATIASSHQLTPFMLLSALTALWAFRAARTRTLLIVAVAATFGWLIFSGTTFLSSNLYWIVASIGRPFGNASDNFINLAAASHGQATVALIDRMLSLSVWGLAAIGVWRRRSTLRADRPAILLALSPIPLLVANSYGGEMLFRVYLFALPFVSFWAAAALFPGRRFGRTTWARCVAVAMATVLLVGFVFAYYGKEKMNYFTPAEVRASEFLYSTAPSGSLVIGATSNLPWAFRNYERYDYEWFALDPPAKRRDIEANPGDALARLATESDAREAYVILTDSQAAEIDMTGIMRPGTIRRIERQLDQSARFVAVFRQPDATIYRWRRP